MTTTSAGGTLSFDGPDFYRIQVQGRLDPSWSGCLGGMRITTREIEGEESVTTLIGNVKDQAALAGILNAIYNLHLPLLKVELLRDRRTA